MKRCSEDEFLAFEASTPLRHEYVAGAVYRLPEEIYRHNRIAVDVLCSLGSRLGNSPFQAFLSPTMVRLRRPDGTRFYHPDGLVVRDANPSTDCFQDRPVTLVEVVSPKSERL